MIDQRKSPPATDASSYAFLILAIRISCLSLLAYWALVIIRPFLAIIVWSVILAVALYPVFDWLSTAFRGWRTLAAATITLASLLILLGPATWLALSLAEDIRTVVERVADGSLAVPPPPEVVKSWPLFGPRLYGIWLDASSNLKALLVDLGPHLKPLGGRLLSIAGNASLNLLMFIFTVAISGFLFIPGRTLVEASKELLSRLATERGEEFINIAGATIRNVSRGVIGVALLQSLLAGVGFLAAGIPASGLLSFLILILGIIQVGPAIVLIPLLIWSWFTMTTTAAIAFTAYMIVVGLLDNVLRPLVMAKGMHTPMFVILMGVIGGTIAHGLLGLFVGPIVLSIAWQLLAAFTTGTPSGDDDPASTNTPGAALETRSPT